MSEEIKDTSGPAFFGLDIGRVGVSFPSWMMHFVPGITKREYYAAMALQGMLSIEGQHQMQYDSTAAQAFKFADAMLKEGQK